jgi:hypothetical protein
MTCLVSLLIEKYKQFERDYYKNYILKIDNVLFLTRCIERKTYVLIWTIYVN